LIPGNIPVSIPEWPYSPGTCDSRNGNFGWPLCHFKFLQIPLESAGMTRFRQESVGHDKDLSRCAFGDDSGDVLIVIRKVQLTKSNSVSSSAPFSPASSSSNCWATIDKSLRRFVKRGVEDEERGEISIGERL